MSGTSQAVFLSYASQDAEAAGRICGALRAAGIEVWFDQSELRGGDVWDQRIRREIRDCTLFVPIISANTASRREGYFRLEWDLADQRSHMMARDRTFIVPVCLDATKEAGTDVPDSFHRVQWTRLPDGNTPPAFTARIAALLGAPGAASGGPTGPVASAAATPAAAAKSASRMRLAALVLVSLVTVVLAYAVVDRFGLFKRTPAERPVTELAPAATPTMPAISDKSVAVLPFADMSEKKDQEYFSDGMAEEIINLLVKVPGLHVPARTSSFYFKGKAAKIPDIARDLGVANVLEGSVRKSRDHMRVTAQLVRADTGFHLWSETYDRQLDDVFKTQDEIAASVVTALKVSLLKAETPNAQLTTSREAYELYLQARALASRGTTSDTLKAYAHLKQAVTLDPQFALAWAALAEMLADDNTNWTSVFAPESSSLRTGEPDLTNYDAVWAQARAAAHSAADQAIAAGPSLAEAHAAKAYVLASLDWEWAAADAEFTKALELAPTNARILTSAAYSSLSLGRVSQGLELANRALSFDPLGSAWGVRSYAQFVGGKFREAEQDARRAIGLHPTVESRHYRLANILLTEGDAQAALAEYEQDLGAHWRVAGMPLALDALGRRREADRTLALAERTYGNGMAYQIACVYAGRKDLERTIYWLERAYKQHDGGLPDLKVDPMLKNVQQDPRYKALLRKMKLPE